MSDVKNFLIGLLRSLFVSINTFYYAQGVDGKYKLMDSPLTDDLLRFHVEGKMTLAVPLVAGTKTKVLCIDFDAKSLAKDLSFFDPTRGIAALPRPLAHALEVAINEVSRRGIQPFVEFSGYKGAHLYVFCPDGVEARHARMVGNEIVSAVKRTISEESRRVVDIEVFPKQDRVEPGARGNCIKLPAGKHLVTGRRNVLFRPEGWHGSQPIEHDESQAALIAEASAANCGPGLVRWAGEIEARQPAQKKSLAVLPDAARPGERPPAILKAPACIQRMWAGVKDGDRDECCYTVLAYLRRNGASRDAGLAAILDWNTRNLPPLDEAQIQEKINRVWANTYSPYRCNDTPFISAFCDPKGCLHALRLLPWQKVPALPIHISDLGNGALVGVKVSVDVMVAGTGSVYYVPCAYDESCNEEEKNRCSGCPGGLRSVHLGIRDRRLLAMIGINDERVIGQLKPCGNCRVSNLGERTGVTPMIVAPIARQIRENERGELVDEKGHDWKRVGAYLTARASTLEGRRVRLTGTVEAHPANQQATLLVSEIEPLMEDVDQFRLTPEVIKEFAVLRTEIISREAVEQKLDEIAWQVQAHVTRIWGSHHRKIHQLILLCLHSALRITFDGMSDLRGYVEIAIVGDSGVAKTKTCERIVDELNLGSLVPGSTSNRVGLLYSLDSHVGEERILVWGVLPMSDRTLLIIDEGQAVPPEQWEQMSSARQQGRVEVRRSLQGEHPSRVRLIVLANPSKERTLADFPIGARALDFMRPADIRRFDGAAIISQDSTAPAEINKSLGERELPERWLTTETLRSSVLWAWSRKIDDVVFSPETVAAIHEQANTMIERFGGARSVPLVSNDQRDKLARLSASVAALTHNTDEAHEKVLVQPAHVEVAADLLTALYSAPDFALDELSKSEGGGSELSDEEYKRIVDTIVKEDSAATYKTLTLDIVRLFVSDPCRRHAEIMNITDTGKKAVSARLEMLKTAGVIKNNKNGYQLSGKGSRFARRFVAEGESITNQIKVYAEYMQRSGLSGYSTPPPVPGTSGGQPV